jgi:hypothetical protein
MVLSSEAEVSIAELFNVFDSSSSLLSRSASGLAGFLVPVDLLKVRIKHFPHQASVFLYIPDNDKGGIWTTRTNASQEWVTTGPGVIINSSFFMLTVPHRSRQCSKAITIAGLGSSSLVY